MKLPGVFFLAALWSTWCLLDTMLEKTKPISSLQNLPPKVTMNLSGVNRSIKPGQQVVYSIEVSDAEDGSTRYQEISPTEVFVEVRYYQSQPDTLHYGFPEDMPGLIYLKEAACFNCHQWKTQLVGPAFVDIISKYHSNHPEQLVFSILQGSIGKWGDEMMPSQPLSEHQAQDIVSWLMNANKNHSYAIQQGTEGFFTTDQNLKQGYYLVTASYRDHGTGESKVNRLTGYHRMVLTVEP
jgi:cytochrome c551/c552